MTAQASQSLVGQTVTVQPSPASVERTTASPVPPTAEQIAASEAYLERSAARWAARANGLPASDPRVVSAGAPAAGTESSARALRAAGGPGPLADGDATFFRTTQLNPAAGGLSSSVVNEPAVAQNGKYVFETWNWGAARSIDGGMTFAYIDPYAAMGGGPPAPAGGFCCDQDVIYDKGRDRMFWFRQGIGGLVSPAGGVENRDFFTVDTGAGPLCTYDIRPSLFGIANAEFDYPRLSLSNNYLYFVTNVFNSTSGAFVEHILMRFPLTGTAACAMVTITNWQFSAGWAPALVEGARDTMFMGDQIFTSTGLSDQFRVYWIFDDSAVLNSVDRTIAPWLFTNRGPGALSAHCPVPGGADPCQRSDQRVTGGVIQHNSPSPNALGASGDRVDFYWNVREGDVFPLPHVESAGFHGGTIAYQQRKNIWNPDVTFFYAAVGTNDRGNVGLSLLQFNPVATGNNPYHVIGIDDDYNGNPPPWELYLTYASTGAWTSSASGDYLRARTHAPSGVAWIASGYTRNAAAGQYLPHYVVFGRMRDVNGFNRFDQQ